MIKSDEKLTKMAQKSLQDSKKNEIKEFANIKEALQFLNKYVRK